MIDRDQVLRDLSSAFAMAEENGLMDEIIAAIKPLHDPVDGEVIFKEVQRAVDELALPLYEPVPKTKSQIIREYAEEKGMPFIDMPMQHVPGKGKSGTIKNDD